MADTKISAATSFTGTGAASRPTARAGSTTAYRTVDNLNATANPAATDGSGSGYHVGSLWRRSDTAEEWYCIDATSTAAVWVPSAYQFDAPRRRFYAFNDCIHTSPTGDHFRGDWTGAGAQITTVAIGSLNAIGVISLDLGTTTGKTSLNSGSLTCVKPGLGVLRFNCKMAIPVLSDGTDRFITRAGFNDNTSGGPTDAIIFRYSDNVNAGKWEAVTRNNGIETATDTGVAVVANDWKRFRIEVNAAATSVAFYINDALVATNTTNIPNTAGRETGYMIMGEKTLGTTSRSGAQVDYIEVEQLFTTAR